MTLNSFEKNSYNFKVIFKKIKNWSHKVFYDFNVKKIIATHIMTFISALSDINLNFIPNNKFGKKLPPKLSFGTGWVAIAR